MRKTSKPFALFLAMAIILSVLSGCGDSNSSTSGDNSAKTGDVITWKMGSVDPESYFMTALAIEWGEAINAATDGRIDCQMFASGALGSDSDMLESLDAGSLQIWEGGSNVICAVNKLFDTWSMLYLYDSTEQKYNFWDTHFDEVTDKLAEETGYRILAVIDGPNRELTSTKPVNDIADLQGFKIRVPEIKPYIDSWNAIGASATAMSFNEVYTSLQTKVIDGQENDILLSESSGFFDVCKNLVMTDHASYEAFIVIKEDAWQSLPDDLKGIVRQCSKDTIQKARDTVSSLVEECLSGLEAKGVTITYPDTVAMRESVQSVYDEYPHIKEYVDLIHTS